MRISYTMKVLLVNGSPHGKGCTYTALCEVAKGLSSEGIDYEILHLGKGDVPGCRGCGYCRKNGRCVIDDMVNETAGRLEEFDGFVFGAPVYYAGPAGQITAFMDRLFYSSGRRMAYKPAAAVIAVALPVAMKALKKRSETVIAMFIAETTSSPRME